MTTPNPPAYGTCKRALYDHLISGKPYTHAMSQDFGISGTASPKRLQELQELHGLTITYEDKKSKRGKPYREYRCVPKEVTQTTLLTLLDFTPYLPLVTKK